MKAECPVCGAPVAAESPAGDICDLCASKRTVGKPGVAQGLVPQRPSLAVGQACRVATPLGQGGVRLLPRRDHWD